MKVIAESNGHHWVEAFNLVCLDAAPAPERRARTSLLKMRTKLGADTPAGHRCSNLLEQLEVRAKSTDRDQIRRLEKLIGRSVAELSALSSTSPKGDRG